MKCKTKWNADGWNLKCYPCDISRWFYSVLATQGFPYKKNFRGHCDPQVVDFGGHFQFERVTYWSLWCLTRVEFLKFVQPEPAENGLFCRVLTHGWHFILPFSKYNQSYFTSQSSQNPLGLDVFLGVLGPGCDSSESSLFLFSFFGCRREKRQQFWLRHFRRLVYRISIVYAQSLSLRSEELDADTVYSFVPNIGDSDPSSRCTYLKITNGADVDLNHSFLKQVLRTQLCVHHDAVVIVIWVIWSKCASKSTKMCVMENPGYIKSYLLFYRQVGSFRKLKDS